jgi:O-antigen ligase
MFIALDAYAIISYETLVLNAIPVLLLLLLFGFYAMDKLLILIVFLTPFSIPLNELMPNLPFNMALPTEPLLFGLMLIFLFKEALDHSYDRKILKHPISIAIFFYLFWMLITSITSTLPAVSFKFLLAKLWFIIGFYFLLILMAKDRKNILKFFWAYLISLTIIVIITVIKHAGYAFDEQSAHFVMNPFYKDHTSYGAILAMYFPIIIGMIYLYRDKKYVKIILFALLGLFLFAIILSYTRAAWVSLIGALGVYLVIKLKINYKWILAGVGILLAVFMIFRTSIIIDLEQNKQDSSSDFKDHIKSISNVATDASNRERINRWNCALRMYREKPFLGWGPGTYQFQYAPFQRSYEKTIISTNAGDMGNAHSEYLGPLSESGILGFISIIIIIITVITVAIKRIIKTKDRDTRTILLMVLSGLTTYVIHGLLNNFLDTDKASAPFWGFIAIIVAIDLYYHNEDDDKKEIPKTTSNTSE